MQFYRHRVLQAVIKVPITKLFGTIICEIMVGCEYELLISLPVKGPKVF